MRKARVQTIESWGQLICRQTHSLNGLPSGKATDFFRDFFQLSQFFFRNQFSMLKLESKQASQQASKPARKQASKQASKPASKQAGQPASKQARKPSEQQESKQRKARKGRVYFFSFFVFQMAKKRLLTRTHKSRMQSHHWAYARSG